MPLRTLLRLLPALGLIATTALHAGTPPVQRSAPPGFEDLTTVETAPVPIVLDGLQIGEAEARIDLSTLTFADPAAVAALVPDLAQPTLVAAALSGPLSLRAELACEDAAARRCGYLAPEVAGIIYDRSAGQVRLFVNPDQRRFTARLGRIRPAAIQPGVVGGANLFFSGDADGGRPRYTINLNATAGAGHRHLLTRGSLSPDRRDLDVFAYRAVRDGDEFRLGLFEGATSQFRSNERLVGLRWGSTLDDLTDRDAYDAPLVVALVAPARIEAFAGERLIGSARYPAGSVRIDTSGFPSGAYVVRLRIDEDGRVREEERFFSREPSFPPLGAPQSFVAVGMRRAPAGFASTAGDLGAELQLGRRKSLGAGFGAGGSLYLREDSVALEAGTTRAFAGGQVGAALLWSSKRELGLSLAPRAVVGPWNLSLDLRHVRPGGTGTGRHLLGSERYTQASVSAGRRFGEASFNLFGSWRSGAQGGSSWSAQPSVDVPVSMFGARGSLRISGSLSADDRQARIEFNLARSPWRGGSLTTRAGYRQDGSPGLLGEVNLQQSLERGGTSGSVGGRLRADPGQQEFGVNGRMNTSLGALSLDATHDLKRSRTNYFGSVEAGLAVTRAGVAFGRSSRNDAAVVFINRSRSADAEATALVDGAKVARVAPKSRRMYGAQPFKAVSVALIPASGAAVATVQRPVLAGLFPGTIAVIDADFVDVTAVYGRLVDGEGKPIPGVWLDSGYAQAQTDPEGWFQVDAAGDSSLQVRLTDGSRCSATLQGLGEDERRASLTAVGDVICRR